MKTIIEIEIDTDKFIYDLALVHILNRLVTKLAIAREKAAQKHWAESGRITGDMQCIKLPFPIMDREGNVIGEMRDGHWSKEEEK